MNYLYVSNFLANEAFDDAYERLMHIAWERRADAPRFEYWSNDEELRAIIRRAALKALGHE